MKLRRFQCDGHVAEKEENICMQKFGKETYWNGPTPLARPRKRRSIAL
jgi:hypothetical protein